MPVSKIDRGDTITIEVEVLSAWADGTVTFSLFGHPGLTTIPGDSPQIVGVEKVKMSTPSRKRANAEVGAQCFEPPRQATDTRRRCPPMHPTLVDKVPVGPNWIHEIKWDGYRVGAYLQDGKVRVLTRNLHDWTKEFPTIVQAMSQLKATGATQSRFRYGQLVLVQFFG